MNESMRTRPGMARAIMQLAFLILAVTTLTACVQNPVTGKRNLQFYDSDWERKVGSGLYEPMRQSQGGDLLIDPELTSYVQEVGTKLAKQARRKDELQFEFHILNDSTPNAWALPGGKVAINRGLLTELETEAELAAVLGHEIVHADAAHSARQQSKGMLTQIGTIASMILIESTVDSSSGKQAAALLPALGAQLLNQRYSRDAERESDEYGMLYMSEAGYDPQGAVQLQETFVRLSEGRPNDWMSGLFASHPPSQERVKNNKKSAAKLPQGGKHGRERYQQKMAYLNRIKPAYDLYDKAMKAASEEDFKTARAHLDEALKIESRESIFHALDGDLKQEAGKNKAALRAYNRAAGLYEGFFYNYLRRGYLYYDMKDRQQARQDLEHSIELLPTASAHYLVGNMDRDSGNMESARKHYGQAVQSSGDSGLLAERELILMDIGKEPERFIATKGTVDENGNVYCLIGNNTRTSMDDIMVAAKFINDSGKIREASQRYDKALGGNERAGVPMGWRTTDAGNIDERLRCVIRGASVAAVEEKKKKKKGSR